MIFKKVFLAFTYNLKCPYFGWCINDSTVKKKKSECVCAAASVISYSLQPYGL